MTDTTKLEMALVKALSMNCGKVYNAVIEESGWEVDTSDVAEITAHLTRAGFVDVDDVTDDDLDANPEQPHKFVAGEECRVCNRWSNNRLHIGSPMHRALTEVSP